MPHLYKAIRATIPYSRVINTPSSSLLTMTLAMTSLAACSGGSSATSLSIDSRSIFDASNLTTNQLNGTDVISGTTNNDIFNLDTSVNNITIAGGDGDDTINAGSGNDILRGGQGSDVISAGAGNDVIIIIGANNNGGSYTDSDLIQTIGGIGNVDISSIVDLASINSTATIDEGTGDIIDGGSGTNALIVFGVVNLTNVTLTNIAEININSDVTVSDAQLATFVADGVIINGDGGSILRITATNPAVIDVESLNLNGVVRVDLDENITLNLGDNSDLNSLTSVQDVAIITGAGTLRSDSSASMNLADYYIDSTIRYQIGSDPAGDFSTLDVARQPTALDSAISANIFGGISHNIAASTTGTINGTNGIDVLDASASTSGITLDGGMGNDTLYGGTGDDTLYGGLGDDILYSSEGSDKFIFNVDFERGYGLAILRAIEPGDDIVQNFTFGEDIFHFSVSAPNILSYLFAHDYITGTLQESNIDGTYTSLMITLRDDTGNSNNITINFDAAGSTPTAGTFGTSAANETIIIDNRSPFFFALGQDQLAGFI